VTETIGKHLRNGRLESVSTDEEATTLSFSFMGFPLEGLNALEMDLRRVAAVDRINIFFNKQGALF
jgi:hypothetical protein